MRYRDTRTGAIYEPRSAFVAAQMAANPALVTLDAPESEQAQDLAALTVAQLRSLCEERGIDYPKKATKAQLVELLDA